jgi:ribosome-associated heat shock protein Hsp15
MDGAPLLSWLYEEGPRAVWGLASVGRIAEIAKACGMMSGMRIDKWLWAARFFKTRALASKACELGRIESNGVQAKPAREVRTGDKLRVKNESGEYQIEVLGLSEMRGPSAMAQALYRESDASREMRLKVAAERKAMLNTEGLRDGKISKRDRREIDRLRGR